MRHSQFHIGLEFWCSEYRYRCTDVGSRVVIAIRVDEVQVSESDERQIQTRKLSEAEANAAGWFLGPPYAVAELVFDEDDLESCSLDQDVKA